LNPVHS